MVKLKNIHPGEVLQEEFLVPMGISQNRIAREIAVPPRRIHEIVHGNRAVTADTALRLKNSGWGFRLITTSRKRAAGSEIDWRNKCTPTLHESHSPEPFSGY
jgi:addiction module HigA family antidote